MAKTPGRPAGGPDATRLKDILHPGLNPDEPHRPFVDEAVTSLLETAPALAPRTDLSIRQFVADGVSSALIARDVPREALCLPRMDVFLPALDAVRYSPVRDAFAALIARSMDRRCAHTVLPAYVEMLRQISADELLLLRGSPQPGRFTPVADIVYVLPNEQIVSAYRNVLPASVAKILSHKDNIPQYVDNLERLNLLYRPEGQEAADTAYRPLARLAFVRDLMKAAPPRASAGFEKSVIGLSDLGDSFLRACII